LFLFLNITMMIIEIIFGIYSNSLGLLTDGVHMFLDSLAIIIGIISSYIAERSKDKNFNFGYSRAEVIGTFVNSVFLIFTALYIVVESLERFVQPRNIKSDNIIFIAFLGLVVNLIGVVFLHEIHNNSSNGIFKDNNKENIDTIDMESGLKAKEKAKVIN